MLFSVVSSYMCVSPSLNKEVNKKCVYLGDTAVEFIDLSQLLLSMNCFSLHLIILTGQGGHSNLPQDKTLKE